MLLRISNVNLLSEGARYHLPCYTKIMNLYHGIGSGSGGIGRPKLDLSDSMEIIYNYINESEERIFTLKELMDLIGK